MDFGKGKKFLERGDAIGKALSKDFFHKMISKNSILLMMLMLFLLPLILSCPKKELGAENSSSIVEQAKTVWKSKGPCPEDMAWVKPANICMDKYEFPNMKDELPLTGVTYEEAERLCKAYGKRLPSSQEWLLACGGKNELIYPYGNEYRAGVCRVDMKYAEGPAPSGTLGDCKSPFGIFDMSGNVWEWTSSEGFEKGTKYVHGGSWRSFAIVATCGFRGWESPAGGGDDYGFRCVKDLNKRKLF